MAVRRSAGSMLVDISPLRDRPEFRRLFALLAVLPSLVDRSKLHAVGALNTLSLRLGTVLAPVAGVAWWLSPARSGAIGSARSRRCAPRRCRGAPGATRRQLERRPTVVPPDRPRAAKARCALCGPHTSSSCGTGSCSA